MKRFLIISLLLLVIVTTISWWALKVTAEVVKENQSISAKYDEATKTLQETDKTFSQRFSGKLEKERFRIYLIARTAAAAEHRVHRDIKGSLRRRRAVNSVLDVLGRVLTGRKMALSEYLGIHARTHAVIGATGSPFDLQRALATTLATTKDKKGVEEIKPAVPAKDATSAEQDLVRTHQKELANSMEAALMRPLLARIAKGEDGAQAPAKNE